MNDHLTDDNLCSVVAVIEDFYGVKLKDIKEKYNQQYPVNAARLMLVFLLRDYCGLKAREVADVLDMSLRNVYLKSREAQKELGRKKKFYSDYNTITDKFFAKYITKKDKNHE